MTNASKITVQHAFTAERHVFRRVSDIHGWSTSRYREGCAAEHGCATDAQVTEFVAQARDSFFGQVFFE